MYNVHAMDKKALRVSEARARFGELLDEAEKGTPVVIERHGVRFLLEAEKPAKTARARLAFDFVDPALMAGDWTWQAGPKGLRFKAGPRKRSAASRTRR